MTLLNFDLVTTTPVTMLPSFKIPLSFNVQSAGIIEGTTPIDLTFSTTGLTPAPVQKSCVLDSTDTTIFFTVDFAEQGGDFQLTVTGSINGSSIPQTIDVA